MRHRSPRATDTTWIYNLESTASLLLALGSVVAALVARHVLPAGPVLDFWTHCLLPMQLPVFYFGYGYLYQRQWLVDSGRSWLVSMGRELVYMLVPLAAVTVPTLLIDGWTGAGPGLSPAALVRALFVDPVVPVGFFLVALALYAVVPTLLSRRQTVLTVSVAAALKVAMVVAQSLPGGAATVAHLPYVVANVCADGIWFCAGMALAAAEGDGRALTALGRPGTLWAAWTVAAVALLWASHAGLVAVPVAEALLTAGGLWAGTALYGYLFPAGGRQWGPFSAVDGYTKGIWLMHPMFLAVWFHLTGPAPLPAPLLVTGSLAVAYGLPVAVNMAMDRLWRLGFLVNPNRYLGLPARDGGPHTTAGGPGGTA